LEDRPVDLVRYGWATTDNFQLHRFTTSKEYCKKFFWKGRYRYSST